MNSDLPEEIAEAAMDGEFQIVKAWLAGGSASDPRPVDSSDGADWTLLHWTSLSGTRTPEYVEFARYLPSRTRRRSPRGREARQARALEFVVRQGDNGIVWHILSFWREAA